MANGFGQNGNVSPSAMTAALNAPARPNQRVEQKPDNRDPLRDSPRLQRQFKTNDDRFHIPQSYWPEGYTLEWKRCTMGGKEEAYYMSELRMNHWQPALVENLPVVSRSLAPFGQESGPIIKADQMLMMRPTYLCDDAREEQRMLGDRIMQSNKTKMKEAPKGTFPRELGIGRVDNAIGPAIRKTNEILNSSDLG
jgi:hypothetical protein